MQVSLRAPHQALDAPKPLITCFLEDKFIVAAFVAALTDALPTKGKHVIESATKDINVLFNLIFIFNPPYFNNF
ncbi:hypothetical protein CLFE_045410 (plasmid) [Clostridium felsineum DSM 794]|nr:hypothetical protein CLFE_045410 [Clostridium felsineum DSM 794]